MSKQILKCQERNVLVPILDVYQFCWAGTIYDSVLASFSPGFGLIQGAFAARCASLQPRSFPCISPDILQCYYGLTFLKSFHIPPFLFLQTFVSSFPGSVWYPKAQRMRTDLFTPQIFEESVDCAMFCINWPLCVSGWLRTILSYVQGALVL